MMRLRCHQWNGIHWLIHLDLVRIGTSITNIDFAKKDAACTLFEHTKDTTGYADGGIVRAMHKCVVYHSSIGCFIFYPPTPSFLFVVAIKEHQTSIAKRLYHASQQALERAAWNNIFTLLVS